MLKPTCAWALLLAMLLLGIVAQAQTSAAHPETPGVVSANAAQLVKFSGTL